MTPIHQILARLLARFRHELVQPDPSERPMLGPHYVSPDGRANPTWGGALLGDAHSRKTVARAMSEQRQWELAALCAEHNLPHLAAEWLIAATSRDGIPRILPPEE